jgi:alkaline phosphatase
MGGGRSAFLHKNILDIEDQRRGKRRDGKNLIETWMRDKLEVDPGAQYITFKDELLALNTSDVDNLLGLFAYDHLEYADKLEENKDPSVEDMTRVAIEILKKNPKGYVLFVEGNVNFPFR